MAKKATRSSNSSKERTSGGVSSKVLIGVVVGGLVMTTGSVLYGRADEGVINVAEVINRSNVEAREDGDEGAVVKNPAANNQPNTPNGGLVGTGKPEPEPEPQPEPEVDGASTTEDGTSSEDDDEASNEAQQGTSTPAETEAES